MFVEIFDRQISLLLVKSVDRILYDQDPILQAEVRMASLFSCGYIHRPR